MTKRLTIYCSTAVILFAGLSLMGLATSCGGGGEPSPITVDESPAPPTSVVPADEDEPSPEPPPMEKPPAVCLGEGAMADEDCGAVFDADLSDGFLVDNSYHPTGADGPEDGTLKNPFSTIEAAVAAVQAEAKAGGSRRNIYLAFSKGTPPYDLPNGLTLNFDNVFDKIRFIGGFYWLAPGQYGRDLSSKTKINSYKSITIKNAKEPVLFDTLYLHAPRLDSLSGLTFVRTRLEGHGDGPKEAVLLNVSILFSKGQTLTIDHSEIVHLGGNINAIALSASSLGELTVTITNSLIQAGSAFNSSIGARFFKTPNTVFKDPVLDVVMADSEVSSGEAQSSFALLMGEKGNDPNALGEKYKVGAVVLERNRITAGFADDGTSIGVGLYHATVPAILRNNFIRGSGYNEAGSGSPNAMGVVMRDSDVSLVGNTIRDARIAVALQRVQDEKITFIDNILQSWANGWGIYVDSTKGASDPIDPKNFMIEEMRYNLFGKLDDGKNYTLYSHPGDAPISCKTFDCLVPMAELNDVATAKKVEGNIIADPLLAADGLTPQTNSPAINAGILVSPYDGETFEDAAIDLFGNPRIHPWDIGAVEAQ